MSDERFSIGARKSIYQERAKKVIANLQKRNMSGQYVSSRQLSLGSGGWIRTNDLRVMSPTSFHCSTPR